MNTGADRRLFTINPTTAECLTPLIIDSPAECNDGYIPAIQLETVNIHNSLQGLQGGQNGQYYHLTQVQYQAVLNSNDPTGTNPFVTLADVQNVHVPVQGVDNGLSLVTGNAELGGPLIKNTNVDLNGYILSFNSTVPGSFFEAQYTDPVNSGVNGGFYADNGQFEAAVNDSVNQIDNSINVLSNGINLVTSTGNGNIPEAFAVFQSTVDRYSNVVRMQWLLESIPNNTIAPQKGFVLLTDYPIVATPTATGIQVFDDTDNIGLIGYKYNPPTGTNITRVFPISGNPAQYAQYGSLELVNTILTGMVTTASGTTATTTTGTYRINNVTYTLASSTNTTIPAQDATLSRYSIIYATTGSTLSIVNGTLSTTPVEPSVPANTVAVATILITPTSITVSGGGKKGTGTVTKVTGVAANGFTWSIANSTTTPAITLTLQNATTSQSGQLTSTDWNTFNNKQSPLTFNNGLTNTSGTVGLGGSLTQNTTISSGANTFNVNGLNADGRTSSLQTGSYWIYLNSGGGPGKSAGFVGTQVNSSTAANSGMSVTNPYNKNKIVRLDTQTTTVWPGIYIVDDIDNVGLLGSALFPLSGDPNQYVQVGNVGNILTFNNGLTNTSGTVGLGGTLSQDTTIELATHGFIFNDVDPTASSYLSLSVTTAASGSNNTTNFSTGFGGTSTTASTTTVGTTQTTLENSQIIVQNGFGNQTALSLGILNQVTDNSTSTVVSVTNKSIELFFVNQGIQVSDSADNFGFKYQADYSPNGILNDRWIPDWGAVKSQLPSGTIPDGIVSGLGTTVSSGIVTVASGSWRISNVVYSTSVSHNVTLDAQDASLSRYDSIFVNAAGTFTMVSGTLSADPIPPSDVAGSIRIVDALITPTSVTLSPAPVTNYVTTNTSQTGITGSKTWVSPHTFTTTNSSNTTGGIYYDGIALYNAATTTGSSQYANSPSLKWQGSIWNPNATAASNTFAFRTTAVGVAGTPSAQLKWDGYIGASSTPTWTNVMKLDLNGGTSPTLSLYTQAGGGYIGVFSAASSTTNSALYTNALYFNSPGNQSYISGSSSLTLATPGGATINTNTNVSTYQYTFGPDGLALFPGLMIKGLFWLRNYNNASSGTTVQEVNGYSQNGNYWTGTQSLGMGWTQVNTTTLSGGVPTTVHAWQYSYGTGPTYITPFKFDSVGNAQSAKSIGSTEITFAAVPTTPYTGQLVNFSDSSVSSGNVTAGGGSNHVMARYDGTNWKVMATTEYVDTMISIQSQRAVYASFQSVM